MEKLMEEKIFRVSEDLSDLVWNDVSGWDVFARDTVGKELVICIDCVSASIAESYGHHSQHGRLHYLYTARGAMFKAAVLLEKAARRELCAGVGLAKCLEKLLPQINDYIATAERAGY